MRKIFLFIAPCLILALLWNDRVHIGGLPFLPLSPAPCAQTGAIRTVKMQQAMVDFYCGVDSGQQDLILEFVNDALQAMPRGVLPSVEVFAFADLDQGLAAEYGLLKGEGYTPSLDGLYSEWHEKGLMGQAFKRAVFLYVGHAAWRQDPSTATRVTVLHEMHHVLQYALINSSRQAPIWLLEGGADNFADLELADLQLPEPPARSSSYTCDYRLADLEDESDVPLACDYLEGDRAVHLLLDEYGRQTYYELFRDIGTNSSFNAAFRSTYGFPLDDFYRLFDDYRRSGYTTHPDFFLPTAPAVP